jgi:hypothetical protein
MQGVIDNIIIKSTKPRKSFYQQYLLEVEEDNSSDEDSMEKLIDEINLIRMRRHLK